MIAALILAAATSGPEKPVRSLAFAFTTTSGATTSTGTIAVDVLGVTKDGALVVRFAQTSAQAGQSFPATGCDVYGDTRVECKDAKNMSPIEMELARLLGRGFVDGNNLDANNHWRLAGPMGAGTETDDFTVTANKGGILSIAESRDLTGPGAAHHAGTISYDLNRTVPLSVKYADGPPGGTPSSTAEVTLTSDSLKSAKPAKP